MIKTNSIHRHSLKVDEKEGVPDNEVSEVVNILELTQGTRGDAC